MLLELYSSNHGVFVKLIPPKSGYINKSMKRHNICKWVLGNRIKIAKSDFTQVTYPNQYQFMDVVDSNKEHVYVLHQRLILRCALNQWSNVGSTIAGKMFKIIVFLFYGSLI